MTLSTENRDPLERTPELPGPATCRLLAVVPTLNEAAHVEQVVRALLAARPAAAQMRVVVADAESTDGTPEIVARLAREAPAVECLRNPRKLQSAAMNLVARKYGAETDVLLRCDAHATYPPDFCERLLGALRQTGADSVVVVLDSVGDTSLQRAVAWVSNSPVGTGGSAHRAGRRSGWVDHGHHAAFRMETFRRVGGYDETFSHNEDAELDCRLRALGGRVYLDAGIRVQYHPRRTWGALVRQYYRYGHGRARTAARHPRSLRARQLVVPLHFTLCAVSILGAPLEPALLLWPGLYLAALAEVSLEMAVRHRSLDGLLAGPAAAVMHAAWAAGFARGWMTRGGESWSPDATNPLYRAEGSAQ
jgi:succinoglycan biosynthesis protein ExoA